MSRFDALNARTLLVVALAMLPAAARAEALNYDYV